MSTCMGASRLMVVFSEEVSSSRQKMSSWVWSAEKIACDRNNGSTVSLTALELP